MNILFSQAMLKCIEDHIHATRSRCGILDVYRTAETIRLANISDNVAREDIIERIIFLAGTRVALEFNKPAFEAERASFNSNGHFNNDSHGGSWMRDTEVLH